MGDVKLEQTQSLDRKEAPVWLHALSRAFERGEDAELEVEVDGDKVEVELE